MLTNLFTIRYLRGDRCHQKCWSHKQISWAISSHKCRLACDCFIRWPPIAANGQLTRKWRMLGAVIVRILAYIAVRSQRYLCWSAVRRRESWRRDTVAIIDGRRQYRKQSLACRPSAGIATADCTGAEILSSSVKWNASSCWRRIRPRCGLRSPARHHLCGYSGYCDADMRLRLLRHSSTCVCSGIAMVTSGWAYLVVVSLKCLGGRGIFAFSASWRLWRRRYQCFHGGYEKASPRKNGMIEPWWERAGNEGAATCSRHSSVSRTELRARCRAFSRKRQQKHFVPPTTSGGDYRRRIETSGISSEWLDIEPTNRNNYFQPKTAIRKWTACVRNEASCTRWDIRASIYFRLHIESNIQEIFRIGKINILVLADAKSFADFTLITMS